MKFTIILHDMHKGSSYYSENFLKASNNFNELWNQVSYSL